MDSKIGKNDIVVDDDRSIRVVISTALTRAGYNVIIHYNSSENDALSLREELLEFGVDVSLFQADLLNDNETLSLFDKCEKLIKRPVNLLINNASIFEYDNIKTATLESISKVMDIYNNVTSFIQKMAENFLKIINLSSCLILRLVIFHKLYHQLFIQ